MLFMKQQYFDTGMDNSYPVKLEILSLHLKQAIQEEVHGEISLTKGTHHFGAVPFFLEKGQQSYLFDTFRIINFFYTPRTTTRKDIFFKINLIDTISEENLGELEISTHYLNDFFSKNRNEIIEKKQQIIEGVTLVYKIYQPKIEVFKTQEKLGFKKMQTDSIINSIFARPEAKPRRTNFHSPEPSNPLLPFIGNLVANAKNTASKEITPPLKQSIKLQQQKQKKNKVQKSVSLDIASIFLGMGNKKNVMQEEKREKDQKQSSDESNKSEQQDIMIELGFKKSEKSVASEDADELLEGVFGLLKESHAISQKNKNTLMPAHEEDHHSQKKLSLKLKFVIFLLFFGFVMLFLDTIQDRESKNIISQTEETPQVKQVEKKQKAKKKKKKGSSHAL